MLSDKSDSINERTHRA